MDETTASAAAKLSRAEVPITLSKQKYAIASMRKQVTALKHTLDEAIAKPIHLKGPTWLPRWIRAAITLKPHPNKIIPLLRAKLDALKAEHASMQEDVIEGFVTPLTIGEEAECNAVYYKTRRHLEMVLDKETEAEGIKAREEAVNFTSNHALNAKRAECIFKIHNDKGELVRAFTAEQSRKLDPRLTLEIWALYVAHYELTEDELGKSLAPKKETSPTPGK